MSSDVHDDAGPPDPARALLERTVVVAPGWLRRVTVGAASRAGVAIPPDDAELDDLVESATTRLVGELADLLATDVDEQRTNPLSVFRAAVEAPTRFLFERGVRPPTADRFASERFPDDPFSLGPATWSDVDPSLHEPGIAWGAWKAMTVLRRRRDEGQR